MDVLGCDECGVKIDRVAASSEVMVRLVSMRLYERGVVGSLDCTRGVSLFEMCGAVGM